MAGITYLHTGGVLSRKSGGGHVPLLYTILISSFSILYPSRHRETISLRGPVFHRSHGHNLVRPGHQSEVNYGYVSEICRKFTRTQSEISITLMGHPQNSNSIVYLSKGFWPLSDMLADQYTTLVIALDWPNLCLK